MRKLSTLTFAALLTALACSVSLAQMPAQPATRPASQVSPEAAKLMDAMAEAYRETDLYFVKYEMEIIASSGGQVLQRQGDIDVAFAFDREADKIASVTADRSGRGAFPSSRAAVVGGQLRMKVDQIEGWHVEKTMTVPMTFKTLAEEAPTLAHPSPAPDVMMLMAEDPLATWRMGANRIEALDANKQGQPGLRIQTGSPQAGNMTLTVRLNPKSNLIEQMTMSMDRPMQMPNGQKATVNMKQVATVAERKIGEPPAEQWFTVDTEGSKAVASMDELVAKGRGNAGAGGGPEALKGKPAPAIDLQTAGGKPFSLAKLDADVVVLDFWATWCGPCRRGLPKLQKVHEWAEQEGKSVAVYTVNLRESTDKAKAMFRDMDLTMPILMDTDGSVAQAYGVKGIPQTVVIHNDLVAEVHVGFNPNMDMQLMSEIEKLLGGD